MRLALITFLVAGAFLASCGDADQLENLQREKTSLEAKVKRLETKIEGLEAKVAQAPSEPDSKNEAPAGDPDPICVKQLTDCTKRLETCEKDPFTGTKYLAGDSKAAPTEAAQAAKGTEE